MREKSAGAVIFRSTKKGRRYLILNYPSGHWDFVKGKIEKGERHHQTVVRETREETGISDLEFVDGFKQTIRYNFQFEGTPISKTVVFYLAETKTRRIVLSHEHLGFMWLDYEDTKKRATYGNAKRVITRAESLLDKD